VWTGVTRDTRPISDIAVQSLDRIPFVINILITAVRQGELDHQLAQAKETTQCSHGPKGGMRTLSI
jgi:hypothetical protein